MTDTRASSPVTAGPPPVTLKRKQIPATDSTVSNKKRSKDVSPVTLAEFDSLEKATAFLEKHGADTKVIQAITEAIEKRPLEPRYTIELSHDAKTGHLNLYWSGRSGSKDDAFVALDDDKKWGEALFNLCPRKTPLEADLTWCIPKGTRFTFTGRTQDGLHEINVSEMIPGVRGTGDEEVPKVVWVRVNPCKGGPLYVNKLRLGGGFGWSKVRAVDIGTVLTEKDYPEYEKFMAEQLGAVRVTITKTALNSSDNAVVFLTLYGRISVMALKRLNLPRCFTIKWEDDANDQGLLDGIDLSE